MARQAKAKLDKKGLSSLGIDKLVDILLEEAGSNKALKSRLQAALAGTSGPEEIAALIDKRLTALETAKTSINSARARDLGVEIAGLIRNVQSELGALDPRAATERMFRIIGLRVSIERRLRSDSVRLMKIIAEAETAARDLVLGLPEKDQIGLVPLIEQERKRDRYHERAGLFESILVGLSRPASDAWEQLLLKSMSGKEPGLMLPRLLQQLYRARGDADNYIRLEAIKPDRYQDPYSTALMLHEARRHVEALAWARKIIKGPRLIYADGEFHQVAGNHQLRELRLLEADILDALKRKDEARDARWKFFLESFDADMLRRHIAKLDDFDEFDEMDKALKVIASSDRIYDALRFYLDWPQLDLAEKHVLRHVSAWDGRRERALEPAAEQLGESSPLAATVLYRALVTSVLDRSLMDSYADAAMWTLSLDAFAEKLPPDAPIISHDAFMDALETKHARKYGYWRLLSDARFYSDDLSQ
jgi:hypothetical protein